MALLHRFLASALPLFLLASLSLAVPAHAQAKAPPSWKEIDQLINEQKFEAAAQGAEARLTQARAKSDEDEWARALVRTVQIRTALHGYETSVRFLREQPWPKGSVPRTVLQLFYAQTLSIYANAYGWEMRQRERVVSSGPVDLKSWTYDQIITEAHRAFAEVWKDRERLGNAPVQSLSEYIQPNTYPAGIRSTMRDAVAYLWVGLLVDSSAWRPEQSHELYQLKLDALLSGIPSVELTDPAVHPLMKMAVVLGDLEAWHRGGKRREAELEARLARYQRLHTAFSEEEDRARIRQHLVAHLEGFRNVPWWAMGQGLLAELERDSGHLIRAHTVAKAGVAAYPNSLGAQRCDSLVSMLEAPQFSLQGMSSDGPRKRSLEVMHRNLPTLYFRAYAYDLEKRISSADEYDLMPNGAALQRLVRQEKPEASWSAALPATTDFREHRTFVTPPLTQPGLYFIVASAREDFAEQGNHVRGVFMTVTPLTAIVRSDQGNRIEVRVVGGDKGRPVPGAEVRLFLTDYQRGHKEAQRAKTDAQGMVTFQRQQEKGYQAFIVVVGRGRDALLLPSQVSFYEPYKEPDSSQTLVFTDRSIYRPLQKILWKVVAFQGSRQQARYKTQENLPVTVSLYDPNNQVVEQRKVRTNSFGTVAGEFTIPPGRVLGNWRVGTEPQGSADVQVEEYKRPTFEVTLKDSDSPLRLNRPATFRGEARYYFGLPVVSGSVRWRVSREPVLPWWWWHGGPMRGRIGGARQVVATGTSPLTEDGSFQLTFTPEADERAAKTPEVSWRYRVEADATDEGGETRSASRAFRLGFVAVEARVETDLGFFREGTPAEVRLVRSNLDGVPQPGKGSWSLVALQQPSQPLLPSEEPIEPSPGAPPQEEGAITTEGDKLRPRWTEDASPDRSLRAWGDGAEQVKGTAEHDAQGLARVTLPALKPGAYRLRYETVDAFGQKFTTTREFLVAGATAPIALPAMLKLERELVRVGEKARLLAFSGFEGQMLFLELYRGEQRIHRQVLTRGKDSPLVELPVTEQMRGGFTVVLVGVRDYQFLRFAQPVHVPYDDKELSLEFTTFRDRMRPGAKETWRVTVKGPKGAKVEAGAAELLAYMYDQSLDLFAPHVPPSVVGLYPSQASGVDLRSSIGVGVMRWVYGQGLGEVRHWSAPVEDSLRFQEGYAIGGPGRRRVLHQNMARAEALPSAAAPMAPPPPPPPGSPPTETLAGNVQPIQSELDSAFGLLGGKAAPPAEKAAQEPPRSNFAETAFWIPQLLMGKDGSATLEFTVPDSVTAWSSWVHAVTRDLKGGAVQRTARSVKELMVRPYVPRFLREGDKAVLEVVVNNASEQRQQGTLTLDILDTVTEKSVLSSFGVSTASQSFTVEPGKGTSLRFPLSTPSKVGSVAFRVTARAGNLGDGELRPLPVLPGRMHLAQSRFVTLRGKDRKVMSFEDLKRNDDPSRINEQLVVTVDAQLFYSALQALPYLVDYPYECTEQTLNRFVSTGIVSSLYGQYPAVAKMAKDMSARPTRFETWDAADPNRKMSLEETPWLQEAQGGADTGLPLVKVLDPAVAKAEREASLAKLRKAQTSSGGFPWWPGGPPSPYMTLYITHGLARAAEYKVEVPTDMVRQAWSYLARHYREEYANKMMKEDRGWEFLTFLNYVASSFPDNSYTGEALSTEERKRILEFSFKHWKKHSPYLKGYLALTLKRAGRTQDAERVWESVMDSAKTSPELGTYWAAEDRSWLWYNDTTETHAFALRTLTELKPKDARRDGLVQWLLLDKKLNHWKSTRATAESIYALVKYLEQEGALGVREDAKVTVGDKSVEFVFEPDKYTGKKNQVLIPGPEVDPVKSSTVVVEKTTKGFAFASATWHFSTEKLPTEDRGDFFQVSRRYFLRVREGKEAVLQPLAEGAKLSPGDEVEVQLSLRTKHAAEYVHLRDPRAAGLEPESAVSRHKWDLGIVWYEETRDSGTNFFFEWLPVGEYTFKYRLRANMAGTFRVGPATVQSMYAPEFTAYSTGAVLTVGSAR
ncbi:alpha-2-macroglobulin family protein [Hyalangium rubrum]|uniref:Alpha-2-macroglobulin family protein n=1 Tax=Hyalangium rubrum TaxID=3103134 RepID=A0ABU5GWD8_9BACT|nr:alpha-2-macroglobulin family protein [Hyalangium sp. s54d21]MDY7224818.1 alpha-2-macroglobulin family protein [Hyalangium sp. s54d21]